jgi:hypothetical protein
MGERENRMKKGRLFIVAVCVVSLAGCATIISGGRQTLNFSSNPAGAKVRIVDSYSNADVYTGVTPLAISLERGNGYFRSAAYRVEISKAGYATRTIQINSTINGWFFGNIFLGAVIGLIVDPITGAMWTLNPQYVSEDLQRSAYSGKEGNFHIVLRESIPDELFEKLHLVACN